MKIPSNLSIFESPVMYILALAALLDAIHRLIQSIHSLNKALPKSFWQKLIKVSKYIIEYVVKEITPPNPSPVVNKAVKVVFAAIFYILVMDCTCLMIIDIIQIWSSDAVAWKKLLGTAVLTIIAFNWRFCLNQGEKLRKELKATSRVLW